MKGYNPPTNVDVEKFLTGFDDEKYIRDISVSNYTNVAKVFIREPNAPKFHIKEYKFTPFLWSKELPPEIKRQFFRWKTIGIPLTDYVEGSKSVILEGKRYEIDDVNVKYGGLTPDNEQHIFSIKLQSEDERLKYYNQKKKEYGVEITKQITHYQGQELTERMDKGFKYMVKIKQKKNPSYTTNPLFLWNSKGKKNKINGTFKNLIDFYQEGGLDIYQRGGDFINKNKLLTRFNNSKLSEKIKLYFNTIHTLKDIDCVFFPENFYDRDKMFNFIKSDEEILNTVEDNLFFSNEEFKISRVNTLKILKYVDINQLLLKIYNADKLKEIFPNISIDEEKLDEFIVINFRSKSAGRLLVEQLKEKNIDIFDSFERYFYTISSTEQFMIQSGKRLFKGYENYEDLRIMTLDIETEVHPNFVGHPKGGLDPDVSRVFKIGIYVNDGYELILEAKTDEEEIEILCKTYDIIAEKDPDLFLTYNGEGFDLPFMERRLELHGCLAENKDGDKTVEEFIRNIFKPHFEFEDTYISAYSLYYRRNANLKVGGASESYVQTNSLGRSFCDTMFAVKRAQAINKKIPNLKLKDNIKFANVAKQNRVYVEGDKIGDIENDKRDYYLNEKTGHYFPNNKAIQFFRSDYDKKHIKASKNGDIFYFSKKKLFIYTVEDVAQHQNNISKCKNSYGINYLDGTNNIIHDLSLFKKRVDESFLTIYYKMVHYDILVAPISGVGNDLKSTHPKHYKYLREKLGELRDNFNNVGKMFPNIDFNEYKKVTGSEIIKRYLIDDLWETYQLDKIYSQATFEVSKWLPTTYQRAATMGTASIWKQLLTSWSYLNGLAIPEYQKERDFNGGLVGMVSSGYHENIVKIDYSSLYPAKFLTDVDSPKIDISGIFKPFLKYALKTRLKFKALKNEAKAKGDKIMAGVYDKKQLPLKIIINSFYGMLGAPIVSPFADIDSAHHITAGSRQGMRHVIRWFGKRNFKVVYFHTDGANFVIPKGIEDYTYIGKGVKNGGNWLTKSGVEYKGVEAYVAEYNDTFMKDFMGVDIDEYADSCINFAKGNFVSLKSFKDKKTGEMIDKVDYVGGAIVKKNQSEYIKDFLFGKEYESVKMLLKGDLNGYINAYYDYLGKIINMEIKSNKIASKARVTKDIKTYHAESKTRQAHMELAIQHGIDVKVGDWIFYINIGDQSTDSDFTVDKTTVGSILLDDTSYEDFVKLFTETFNEDKNKLKDLLYTFYESGELIMKKSRVETEEGNKLQPKMYLLQDVENWNGIKFSKKKNKKGEFIEIIREKEINNSRLINVEELDENVVYNVKKYVKQFNAAIAPLWVAFEPEIRDKVITDNLDSEREYFLNSELKFSNGKPLKGREKMQDNLEDLLKTEQIEKDLWLLKGYSPFWAFTRESFNNKGYFKIKDGNHVEIDKNEYDNKSDESFNYVDSKGLVDWFCENPFVDYE